jgi:hypothetical protein
VKVSSGCDPESAELIAKVYELVVKAGVHRASSIKVAEAVARWDAWQPDAADGDVAAHRERQERRLRLDRLGAQFALR